MAISSVENSSRRNFLRTAPAVAAAGLTLADGSIFGPAAGAQLVGMTSFAIFTNDTIQADIKALEANPGNNNLVIDKNFTVVLTVETAKSAKEFEWHEHRDHVLQILDGTTVVELGGEPKGAHSSGPGEWNAPESVGSTAHTLKKGDMLVIPRNTPHKRSTVGTVTLILISPQGTAASPRMPA
jgi:quercetin dioxygenase-like cupin family protein